MRSAEPMKPQELLVEARRLVEKPSLLTGGLWGRAATILARQALEEQLALILAGHAPQGRGAPFDAQLLVLAELLPDRALAVRARFVWSALSSASHLQGYELPPTAQELRDWFDVVQKLIDARAVQGR